MVTSMAEKRKRYVHRCFNCEYIRYDGSLEYYPCYRCKAHMNHSITIGVTGEVERPKWCPQYGPEDPECELVEYV